MCVCVIMFNKYGCVIVELGVEKSSNMCVNELIQHLCCRFVRHFITCFVTYTNQEKILLLHIFSFDVRLENIAERKLIHTCGSLYEILQSKRKTIVRTYLQVFL